MIALLLLIGCGPRHLDLAGPYGIRDHAPLEVRDPDHLRLLLVGDIGERLDPGPYRAQGFPKSERRRTPHPAQSTIAASTREACGETGCDLALILGDNIYPAGISGGRHQSDDEALLGNAIDGYGTPYSLVVLGNHDWGPSLPRTRRAHRELDLIATYPDWLGGHFYSVDAGIVRFVALDSNYLVRRGKEAGDPVLNHWVEDRLDTDQWTVVLGHHPLRSASRHGDAGSYHDVGMRLWSGKRYRTWTDQQLVGHTDFYASGHEHDLQFFELPGHTAAIVSGSAAECSAPPSTIRPSPIAPTFLRNGYGFAILDLSPSAATVTFYDVAGAPLWQAKRQRNGDWTYPTGPQVDPAHSCAEDAEQMKDIQRNTP